MSSRIHKLPSLGYQNGNDSCTTSADCALGLVCFKKSKVVWLNDGTVIKFLRHDDVPKSNNYIDGAPGSIDGFCSCDRSFGWTGYDCTEYDSSWSGEVAYLGLMILCFTLLMAFAIYVLSYRLFRLNHNIFRDMVSKTLIPLISSLFVGIFSLSFRIRQTMSPKDLEYKVDPNGERYIRYGTAFAISNVVVSFFLIVTLLHLILSWVIIVERMKLSSSMMSSKILTFVVISLESFLFVAGIACVVSGLSIFVYGIVVVYDIGICIFCVYARNKLDGLIKTISKAVEDKMHSSQKGASPAGIRIIVKKGAIRIVLVSIVFVASVFATVTLSLGLGVIDQTQTPEGEFNRPYMYLIYFAVHVTTALFAMVILRYVSELTFKQNMNSVAKSNSSAVGVVVVVGATKSNSTAQDTDKHLSFPVNQVESFSPSDG